MRIGTLKETYVADAALFDSRTQKVWLVVGAALLVLFPFMASDYWLYLACLVSINVASATGLNILTGYTGLLSLGQAAIMGLGAYTVAGWWWAFRRCVSKACTWPLPPLQRLLSCIFCLPISRSPAARVA